MQRKRTVTSALTGFFLFLSIFHRTSAASDSLVIEVRPGENVILPCKANVSFVIVEWTRADLQSEYVLLYTDGRLNPTNQHPVFRDRVQLVDKDMKDGNVSLTLKNVSSSDAGTYECRVDESEGRRTKRSVLETEPIRTIQLEVTGSERQISTNGNQENDKPPRGNSTPLSVGLSVGSVVLALLVSAAVFVLWKHVGRRVRKPDADVETVDEKRYSPLNA